MRSLSIRKSIPIRIFTGGSRSGGLLACLLRSGVQIAISCRSLKRVWALERTQVAVRGPTKEIWNTSMSYQPIENYGIIGDMHSVALVGMNGSIDWYCYPHFDSPSVFGRILDHGKGVYFQIAAAGAASHKQLYWPATNILITRFLTPDGVGEVTDYMPVGEAREKDDFHRLIRRVSVVRGSLTFHLECQPAFNYARD